MKYLSLLLPFFCVSANISFTQSLNVECLVIKRTADHVVLTPAHFDLESLPRVGQQVMFSMYAKDDLPVNKSSGYYELFLVEVIKLNADNKSITIKTSSSFEDRKIEIGLPQLNFTNGSRVKISWKK